jgi:hypothetical protein
LCAVRPNRHVGVVFVNGWISRPAFAVKLMDD